jgi:nitroreductase
MTATLTPAAIDQSSSWKELLRARYGEAPASAWAPPASPGAEVKLKGLLAHRSVRKFAPDPLPQGALEWIIAAAQSAASSSNLQTWSIVALEDKEHKSKAAALAANQEFIRQAPLFLAFIADLSRLRFVSEKAGLPGEGLDFQEMFLMASLDAALAAQNAVVAAEALGLGICYVGAARNKPLEFAELLGLPPNAYVVFGLAVGVPAAEDTAAIKPRLPLEEVLHRETYSTAQRAANVDRYDAAMRRFYAEQGLEVPGDWSLHSAKRVASVEALRGRDRLKDILRRLGFALK